MGGLDRVGQVDLALGVIRAERLEDLAQERDVKDVGGGADLVDAELVVRGVGVLNDADHRSGGARVASHLVGAGGVALDAAVARRIFEDGGQDGHRVIAGLVGLGELGQGRGGEHWHITGNDEHGAFKIRRERLQATPRSPAGSLNVVLVGNQRVGIDLFDVGCDPVALVADHENRVLGASPEDGVVHVPHERTPAHRQQNFRNFRLYSGAFTCRENNCGRQLCHGAS